MRDSLRASGVAHDDFAEAAGWRVKQLEKALRGEKALALARLLGAADDRRTAPAVKVIATLLLHRAESAARTTRLTASERLALIVAEVGTVATAISRGVDGDPLLKQLCEARDQLDRAIGEVRARKVGAP